MRFGPLGPTPLQDGRLDLPLVEASLLIARYRVIGMQFTRFVVWADYSERTPLLNVRHILLDILGRRV